MKTSGEIKKAPQLECGAFLKNRKEVHDMKKRNTFKKDNDPFHHPTTDPQGSYTGVPELSIEKPVQDVDDL